MWQLENNILQQNFIAHNGKISDVAISSDGHLFVTASQDRIIKLWAVDGNQIQTYPIIAYIGHEAPITSVAFQPSGKYIASGSDDKTVRLWLIP